MFDALTDRLQGVMQSLNGHGKLTAEDVDAAMRAIRLALFEAVPSAAEDAVSIPPRVTPLDAAAVSARPTVLAARPIQA